MIKIYLITCVLGRQYLPSLGGHYHKLTTFFRLVVLLRPQKDKKWDNQTSVSHKYEVKSYGHNHRIITQK
jgi:hypothetical protein